MILVCINKGKIKNLTEGRKYTIVRENKGLHSNSDKNYHNIWVINDAGIERHYSTKRFITISEWRNINLNQLGI